METIEIKSEKQSNNIILKYSISLLSVMMIFSSNVFASANLAEEQEKAAHNEFMSYVFMVLGFALVILTTIYATIKDKKEVNKEEGHHSNLNHKLNHSHDPYFKKHRAHLSRR